MTITINGGSTTKYFQGWDSFKNPISYTTQYTTSSGGTTTATVNEASYTTYLSASATVNNIIHCNKTIVAYTNNTPSLYSATYDSATNTINAVTTTTDAGTFPVTATLGTGSGDLLSSFQCIVGGSYTYAYLTAYNSSSLAYYINNLIVTAVGGRTVPNYTFMNLYGGATPTDANPNLYTKNIIDITPFTANGYANGACLISPRHVVGVTHSRIAVGTQIIFTDKNGNQIPKTILSKEDSVGGGDITIAYLDSAVTGITPYSVLPTNATATTKIPMASQNTGAYGVLPLGVYGFTAKVRYPFGYVGANISVRQMQLSVINNIEGSTTSKDWGGISGCNAPGVQLGNSSDIRTPYSNWWSFIADGDSGSPTLLPTGLTTATGTPLTILIGQQSFGGSPGICSSLSYNITQINTAMNSLASAYGDTTTYALDQINISQSSWWNSFTSY